MPNLIPSHPADIYQPSVVARLFDEMSATYGFVNVISSFGFCVLWRKQCVGHIRWRPGAVVYDLMSGMGELWPSMVRRLRPGGEILAVDISEQMCKHANAAAGVKAGVPIAIHQADVLDNDLPDASADVIISSFGLKTFSPSQQRLLAIQVRRLLKPGGPFSFLEISTPPNRLLRSLYLFYLHRLIPPIGRACLGNPDNYRMLGVYTQAFENVRGFADALREAGLEVRCHRHFFGCATAVSGSRNRD
jgi:ubiquinone/menaquinone biosynthesis methyltransferase